MKFRLIILLVMMACLCFVLIDYFWLGELWMESTYVVIFSGILIINILRQYLWYDSLNIVPGIVLNLGLLAFFCYNLYILSIFAIGFGFMGKDTQNMVTIAFILNMTLGIVSISDIAKLQRHNTK